MQRPARFTEIETVDHYVAQHHSLRHCVIQGLDLRNVHMEWAVLDVHNAVFLGCTFGSDTDVARLQQAGAFVFPEFADLPYQPYRSQLYTWQELMDGFDEEDDQSYDHRIYRHFQGYRSQGHDIMEALAQRLHDHAIDDALQDLLHRDPARRPVGIMGGHGTSRTDPVFRQVALTARELTRRGYFVATGGGPGVMEAANLGAYLAPAPDDAIDHALSLLAPAPTFHDRGFVALARDVLHAYPEGAENLAVPTWFYGHEPSNLFASHIAKYFSNSLREDGLLALAVHGIVFAPGGAGTVQEVFQDACQNHYVTFGCVSPMIFLGSRHFTDTGIFPTLTQLADGREYRNRMFLADDPIEIADRIDANPPVYPTSPTG